MARFDRLAYRDPTPSQLLIRALGPLVRFGVLPLLRIRKVDFPPADERRVRALVRPDTSVFLGPNHPEFMTDWMIDKEISRRVAPLAAHWASYEIVNLDTVSQSFWLRNNLVANAPKGGGRAYSVRWANRGHGVLLHPEGTPSGHGDHVGPLVPGIVEMAALASASGRPTFIQPLVWKLRFTGEIERALAGEMQRIERGLGFAGLGRLAVPERFAALQRAILARSIERHGTGVGGEFFAAQEAHGDALFARLEARYGPTEGNPPKRRHVLRRAILARKAEGDEAAAADRRVLLEVERLEGFSRALYGGPTLTQEQVAESLKQARLAFLTRGFANALHQALPIAVAERVAHVRAPEAIAVRGESPGLLEELHARLEGGVDALNEELAPLVDPFRMPNLLHADEPALA